MASIGALLADPSRCRVLLALDDGRALPASRLAAEAGVAASTASSHLGKLVDAGLLTVQSQGRHRYYRLAGPDVGRLIESVIQLAPAQPIRSLRQDTRAHALRQARTCYDHLAGRLGVSLMGALIERGALTGGDGTFDPDDAVDDRYSSYGHDIDYQLRSRPAQPGRATHVRRRPDSPRQRPSTITSASPSPAAHAVRAAYTRCGTCAARETCVRPARPRCGRRGPRQDLG
jgi:DNA-binding transcriptional ArsR family regulator